MIKTDELIKKYGDPTLDKMKFINSFMILWDIPNDINLKIPVLPNKIYINKDFAPILENVFRKLIEKNLHTEIKTYDGCFNIRKMRGSNKPSRHSWGIAIDFNAFENPYKKVPKGYLTEYRKRFIKWSDAFLNVWREQGCECGADWVSVVDGMHFEPKILP